MIEAIWKKHKSRIELGLYVNKYHKANSFKDLEEDFRTFMRNELNSFDPDLLNCFFSSIDNDRGIGDKTIARALSKKMSMPPQASEKFLNFLGYYTYGNEWKLMKELYVNKIAKIEPSKLNAYQNTKSDQNKTIKFDEWVFNAGISNLAQDNSLKPNIDGLWLSKFTYITKRGDIHTTKRQYNIERLTYISDTILVGKNILSSSGDDIIYKHDLHLQLFNNYLLGIWQNSNTKNLGTFQLYIHTNHFIMSGMHTGNSNDNSINSGNWWWIKLDSDEKSNENTLDIHNYKIMNNIEYLDRNFDNWMSRYKRIPINEILTLR